MRNQRWEVANQKLMAKAFSELDFEDLFEFDTLMQTKEGIENIEIVLNGQRWSYQAKQSIWGMRNPISGSIKCNDKNNPTITQLLIDLQKTVSINDIDLSGLLEEIQQTLFSEINRLEILDKVTNQDIVYCSEIQRQKYLDAHPKVIANKGRLGWGEAELARYSPETSEGFQLRYIAIKKHLCHFGFRSDLTPLDVLSKTMSEQDYSGLVTKIPQRDLNEYLVLAVHPWQYQRFITIQFQEYLQNEDIIDLGLVGGSWIPQQSIRTLSTLDQSVPYDVKTALTILNTSCYRGIPGKYIQQGPEISKWLANIASRDPLLKKTGLHVQQELGGVYCPHPYQSKIEGAYRYSEMLGCIWRERAEAVLSDNQRPLSMATLMQDDGQGNACINELIASSGLSHEQWLRAMFWHVVIPIYHLMCRYGVGLVAHGQNVTLVLEDNIPTGCIIKDFHGDLRLVDQPYPELASLEQSIQDNLTRLPPHYLVHDLLTGHFVTVLRFVSPWLESEGISEALFYGYLADEVKTYQTSHPELKERFKQFNLLSESIDKICLNRVRFKIGYGDSSERPLPELGKPIPNPLLIGLTTLDKQQC
ncbi:IucA/IucC family protein [Vibrio maritimus]|uniref:IucA/IucC family protein n=1 Tax=Vibrio maritimus TaxID=990268 RepID=UPI001F44A106|nr:IucA/IucC family protein [Vibrio maritimus]